MPQLLDYVCDEHLLDGMARGQSSYWLYPGVEMGCEHPSHGDVFHVAEFQRFTLTVQPAATLDDIMAAVRASQEHPPVTVMFKTSSQPKGQDGVEIHITSAAKTEDAYHVLAMAWNTFAEAKKLMAKGDDDDQPAAL